mmetsp:Transcript_26139/g.59728  ORF Transcript_26139/g.59728 Transcript_26139/m.59728 type:complete len:99 (+) Transcript_26139:35-331(+)
MDAAHATTTPTTAGDGRAQCSSWRKSQHALGESELPLAMGTCLNRHFHPRRHPPDELKKEHGSASGAHRCTISRSTSCASTSNAGPPPSGCTLYRAFG